MLQPVLASGSKVRVRLPGLRWFAPLLLALLWNAEAAAALACNPNWAGSPGDQQGQFNRPSDVAIDSQGNVYAVDDFNHRVQKLAANGSVIRSWGGLGTGTGQFDSPSAIAVDLDDNVYVVDSGNDRVQKFNANGVYLLQWGGNGTSNGRFDWPYGIAVGADGTVFVTDAYNHRIQSFSNTGTYLRQWGGRGTGNGQFDFPAGIDVDAGGNVYVADKNNHRIQKFTRLGVFQRQWGGLGTGDSQFAEPFGVAVDAVGHVFVADTGNNAVKKFDSNGGWISPTATAFARPRGLATRSGDIGYVANTGAHRLGSCTEFNARPTAQSIAVSTLEDLPKTFATAEFSSRFIDTDRDVLDRVRISSLPTAGTLLLDGTAVALDAEVAAADLAKLVFTPPANGNGSYSFGWRGSDGAAISAAATVTISVTAVNDAPAFSAVDPSTIDEDAGAQTLVGWATFMAGPADESGQAASYIVGAVSNAALFADLPKVSAAGTLTYTPADNASGVSSFEAHVMDNGGTANGGADTSIARTFTITVNAVNDAPVFAQGTASTVGMDEDGTPTPFVLSLSAGDVEGDALSWGLATPAGKGSVSLSGSGNSRGVVYQPNANYHGADSFSIAVADGNGGQATHTVTVNILPRNDLPTGADRSASLNEDTRHTVTAADFGYADIDGDPLAQVQIVTLPAQGELQLNGVAVSAGAIVPVAAISAGQLGFAPVADANGSPYAVMSFKVNDGSGYSAAANSLTFNVIAVADTPSIAGTPAVSVLEGEAYGFTPSAADPDAATTLVFSIANKPDWASFDTTSGALSGTPGNGDAGAYSGILISVSDGALSASLPAFTLTVVNVNQAPTLTGTPLTSVDQDKTYAFTAVAADPDDGDTLVFSIQNKPVWASFDTATGALTGTPGNAHVGTHADIVISVSDGELTASLAAFPITVVNVNDAPVITGTPLTSIAEEILYAFTPTATDPDADAALVFSIANKPAWASFDTTSGALSGTPAKADVGDYADIVISVSDGTLSASLPAFTLSVTRVNSAPEISGTPAATVQEDSPYYFKAEASDEDSIDTLVFSADNLPAWAVLDAESGELTGAPGNADVGAYPGIVIKVSDGTLSASLPAFTLTVVNTNDAPYLTGTPLTGVDQDALYSFAPSARDDDVGDTLVFGIDNKPVWASFDTATGVLSGTPGNADVGLYADIVIHVSDADSTVSLPAFSITVANINDAPVIDGVPAAQVYEGREYLFTPIVADPDSQDVLVFTVENLPGWMSFDSATGTLSGIPGRGDAGSYPDIVIGVSDGAFFQGLPPFTLAVIPDLDGDGIADALDDDTDGDGLPDDVELALGLDPLDPADALTDLDGDGSSNIDEHLAGTPLDRDSTPPQVSAPADVTVPASGLFTRVALGQAQAFDYLDGDIEPGHDAPALFAPGRHEVTWSASDQAGNRGSAIQIVNVEPLVEFAKDQSAAEGARVVVRVLLNGPAPRYPVVVPYTVGGSAGYPSDHGLRSGFALISASEATETHIAIDLIEDAVGGEGDETIVLSLGSAVNAVPGANTEHTITIVEGNVAPAVTMTSEQQGLRTLQVARGDGPVTVLAMVSDPNLNDSHRYDWSWSDPALIDLDADVDRFSFDPAVLAPGLYTLRLRVVDDGLPPLSGGGELRLRVVASQPVLGSEDSDGDGIADASEGLRDDDGDGIADYLDAIPASNVLQQTKGNSTAYLAETEPGITLRLGSVAFASGTEASNVTADQIGGHHEVVADTVTNIGGYFDFEATALPAPGQSLRVVLPQREAVPERAVYRKLIRGGWRDFAIDQRNGVASAAGEPGFCPPPGDAAYVAGLTPGHWCVQLTIEDGGPNDADGSVDANISDPGGVGQLAVAGDEGGDYASDRHSKRDGGFGSGGWLLLLLAGAACLRRRSAAGGRG